MYNTMSRLIENEKTKLKQNYITQEQYDVWKERTQVKLDTFLACDRLTIDLYQSLVESMVVE